MLPSSKADKQNLLQSQQRSFQIQQSSIYHNSNSLNPPSSNSCRSNPTSNSSQYLEEYNEYLKPMAYQPLPKSLLSSRGVTYNQFFRKQIKIDIVNQQDDCCIIQVSWGYFIMEISLLRVLLPGKNLHGERIAGNGAYSKVFLTFYKSRNYIVKSIQLTKSAQTLQYASYGFDPTVTPILSVISEYFLTKIASLHKIAPEVFNLFGFDIIIYNDCVDFVLEACQNLRFKEREIEYVESQMKQNLRVLHSLKICHRDIKPSNLMWSQALNKPIFIDFGLAQLVSENIGEKTLSFFVGTFLFSGEEMKKVYTQRQKKYVDLYYNDVQSLHQSFQHEKNRVQNSSSMNQSQYQYEAVNVRQINLTESLINLFRIKHSLLLKNYEWALELISQQKYMTKSITKIYLQQFASFNFQGSALNQKMEQTKARLDYLKNRFTKFDIQFSQYLTQYYDNKKVIDIPQIQLSTNREDFISALSKRTNIQKIMNIFHPKRQRNFKVTQSIRFNLLKRIAQLYELPVFASKKKDSFQVQEVSTPSVPFLVHFMIQNFLIPNLDFQKNRVYMQQLREICIVIDDYSTCYQIQNMVLDKYIFDCTGSEKNHDQKNGLGSLAQFFVIAMFYYVERRKWVSSAGWYPDRQRYFQVKNQKIPNDRSLDLLKTAAELIISSNFSLQGLKNYEKAAKNIEQALKSPSILPDLEQKLLSIKQWCGLLLSIRTQIQNTSQGSFPSSSTMQFLVLLSSTQIKENILNINPNLVLANVNDFDRQFDYEGGYYIIFQRLKRFEPLPEGLMNQFLYVASRNNKMLCFQIERIICSELVVNFHLKIQLFQAYVKKVKIEEDSGWLQLLVALSVIFDGMNALMIYLQKRTDFQNISISFYYGFVSDLLNLYSQILSIIEASNYGQHINKILMNIVDCQLTYISPFSGKISTEWQKQNENEALSAGTCDLEKYISMILKDCRKFIQALAQIQALDNYTVFILLKHYKILFVMYGCRKPDLKEQLVMLLHVVI